MFLDKLNVVIGIIKMFFYKLLFFKRIQIKGIPKINSSFKFKIANKSRVIISKRFEARERLMLRAEKGGKIEIGDQVFFNDNCSLHCLKNIKIGNRVTIGPNVTIIDHDHDYKNNYKNFITQEVKIEDDVWIGANVTILKGITIGRGAIIAAGTLVTKNIEKDTLFLNKREEIKKTIIMKK